MLCAQAWKPSSQHAGEERGVAGLLLGRTERGVAFQAPPGSQASSRGEAKDSALLSSHDAALTMLPITLKQLAGQNSGAAFPAR